MSNDEGKIRFVEYNPLPALTIRSDYDSAAYLQIWDEDGRCLVTVNRDHTVTLPDPERLNDAARIFWEAIQNFGVAHCVVTHSTVD